MGGTTLGSKYDGATVGTKAHATEEANATKVGPADHAAVDDATAADADDGTADTDAPWDATHDDDHAAAAGKQDGSKTAV